MAELLAGSMGQTETIKPGKIVDGTIKVVKGNDVFIDIGYKSEGKVDLTEFSDPAAAKPGEKVQVLVRELENDKTGMVSLSKKAADIQIRWEKVLALYTEGCVVTGTIQSQVHGGLLVDIDGVEAFLPGSQVDVAGGRFPCARPHHLHRPDIRIQGHQDLQRAQEHYRQPPRAH